MLARIPVLLAAALALAASPAHAGDVTIPHTFASGTKAVAQEVNDNFDAVEAAVDDNAAVAVANGTEIANNAAAITTNASDVAALQALVASLQATVSALEGRLADVEGNTVLALDGELTRDTDDLDRPRALFTGVNVQVTNGVDSGTPNGVGNLIVGFDLPQTSLGTPFCTDGQFDNQTDCEAAGEVWGVNQKGGSHNLVVGNQHSYTRTNGAVFGFQNTVNRDGATVTGGFSNLASGSNSVVAGGFSNQATGLESVVSGGSLNLASGGVSAVSGGSANEASGALSSVSGGANNQAAGSTSSVTGGQGNSATGQGAGVTGGVGNIATGTNATVSGGSSRKALGQDDWAAGALLQDN